MKSLFISLFFLFSLSVSGQQNHYYKMPNGKIIDAETYQKVKDNLSKNGKVEERIVSKTNRNDSVIITPKITVLTVKDKKGNYIDPYGEQKKLIGTRFPIERFKNEKGTNYPKTFLSGKPTIINFWFTNCIPCVAEIPLLDSLHIQSRNKFNCIAITFEDQKTVDAFLKKVNFSFTHILNAKKEINNLKISAFPTNLILDKNGYVVDVYGEISSSSNQISILLNNLL
ncbi:TlpA disulfide reductase family protein [uncultured Pedobacter sp.]|uniref:TlpA family protein disulfide reductase n=1 Tax=uncultured Pedobacter sp. TaxID=246139 RepID=UPI0025F745B6|nr:TlpA disulfide reductase family protein [uncultured Pedobacter sp.]